MNSTRRDFIGLAATAAGGLAAEAAGGAAAARPAGAPPFMWCALVQLGTNTCDDFLLGPDDWARSQAEEAKRPNPYGPNRADKRCKRSRYHSYLRCNDAIFRDNIDYSTGMGSGEPFI